MILMTSAAGNGLHPAFSKQPGINDQKSEFRKSKKRLYPNHYMSNKKYVVRSDQVHIYRSQLKFKLFMLGSDVYDIF